MRLAEGGQWNALNIFFATDCLPPATLALGSTGWVPTLQLTSYLRRVPSSDWVAVRQWIRSIADGVAEEHCEVFDESGDLVASATQVALVRFTQGS
jgi:acyl-CoA thioesterase